MKTIVAFVTASKSNMAIIDKHCIGGIQMEDMTKKSGSWEDVWILSLFGVFSLSEEDFLLSMVSETMNMVLTSCRSRCCFNIFVVITVTKAQRNITYTTMEPIVGQGT